MSLQCPYCDGWSPDTENLPEEQEEKRPVKCYKCGKVFVIWWQIEHNAEKLSDALRWFTPTGIEEFIEEVQEVIAS